jgi:hypothetical protein
MGSGVRWEVGSEPESRSRFSDEKKIGLPREYNYSPLPCLMHGYYID